MTTRPKRTTSKPAAAKKPAAKTAAARKSGKAAAGKKTAGKTRGAKPARHRKAPKKSARPTPKNRASKNKSRANKSRAGKAAVKTAKRSARQRQLATLAASGRRPKSAGGRGAGRRRSVIGRPVAQPRAPRIAGVAVKGAMGPRYAEVLTPAALRFLADLHREFEVVRERCVTARGELQQHDAAQPLAFPPGTEVIRHAAADRPAEIVIPADRLAMLSALDSGVDLVVADFASAPAQGFAGSIAGQIALKDHWAGKLAESREQEAPSGKPATLSVRPRGWDAVERHLTVDGAPIAAALFDFGLGFFHNAARQVAAGTTPHFDLLPLEAPGEARLWNDVLAFAQERLGLDAGTIRAILRIRSEPGLFELIV
jgi:hypothetical protein